MRVAFVPRSAEIQPLFWRFVTFIPLLTKLTTPSLYLINYWLIKYKKKFFFKEVTRGVERVFHWWQNINRANSKGLSWELARMSGNGDFWELPQSPVPSQICFKWKSSLFRLYLTQILMLKLFGELAPCFLYVNKIVKGLDSTSNSDSSRSRSFVRIVIENVDVGLSRLWKVRFEERKIACLGLCWKSF